MKSKFADPLETFRLMETFVLGKILNPIYQVVVSDSTKFEGRLFKLFIKKNQLCKQNKQMLEIL